MSRNQSTLTNLVHISVATLLFVQACSDSTGPHGRATAITYIEDAGQNRSALVVTSPDGRNELARYPLPYTPDEAQLSPDHRMILLTDPFATSISVMQVADRSVRKIVSETGVGEPEWSRDGRSVLYYSPQNGGTVWTVEADGTNARPIATGTSAILQQHDPMWSPDGSRIVFDAPWDGSSITVPYRLYVMNADGSDPHLLPLDTTIVPDNLFEPAWSPDGTRIAFVAAFDGGYGIVEAKADGSGARRLTAGGDIQRSPWWSPDGKMIVYMDTEPNGWWRLFVVDLATGTIRQVTFDLSYPTNDTSPHWISWP